MWVLSFIPDSFLFFVVLTILFAGIGLYAFSFFTRLIPPLIPYTGIVRTLATILLIAGVYFYGSYATESEWREKVAEAQAKVDAAAVESKKVNTVIQTKVVEKVKLVKDVQLLIQEKIVEKEKIIDADCKVSPEAIDLLNQAAKRPEVKK
jgi:hypothetical protein